MTIYMINLLFTVFKDEKRAGLIAFLLLSPRLTKRFYQNLQKEINYPAFHTKNWTSQNKIFDHKNPLVEKMYLKSANFFIKNFNLPDLG